MLLETTGTDTELRQYFAAIRYPSNNHVTSFQNLKNDILQQALLLDPTAQKSQQSQNSNVTVGLKRVMLTSPPDHCWD